MKLVFDVDGTISFDGQKIDDQIIREIKELPVKQDELVFASARPIRDLLPIVRMFSNSSLIGGNGSIISLKGRVRVTSPIKSQDYQFLKMLIKANHLDYLIDGKWDYSAHVQQGSPILRQLDPDHLAHNVDLKGLRQPIKAILLNLSNQQMQLLAKQLRGQTALSIVEHHGENNLDMTATGINKYATLRKLFPKDDYIAFGNDDNDRELLAGARKSVWIGSLDRAEQAGVLHPDFNYSANVSGAMQAIERIRNFLKNDMIC